MDENYIPMNPSMSADERKAVRARRKASEESQLRKAKEHSAEVLSNMTPAEREQFEVERVVWKGMFK